MDKNNQRLLCAIIIVLGCIVFGFLFRNTGKELGILVSWIAFGFSALISIWYLWGNFKRNA